MSFFYSYSALFALILLYFCIYFTLLLPIFLFFFPLSSFIFHIFRLFFSPFSYFFSQISGFFFLQCTLYGIPLYTSQIIDYPSEHFCAPNKLIAMYRNFLDFCQLSCSHPVSPRRAALLDLAALSIQVCRARLSFLLILSTFSPSFPIPVAMYRIVLHYFYEYYFFHEIFANGRL